MQAVHVDCGHPPFDLPSINDRTTMKLCTMLSFDSDPARLAAQVRDRESDLDEFGRVGGHLVLAVVVRLVCQSRSTGQT